MPETDYAITDRIEEVKEHRKHLQDAYDSCLRFINDRRLFLRDKGDVFFSVLGELRKYAVQAPKSHAKEALLSQGMEETQEQEEGAKTHRFLSSTMAGAIVAGISIVGIVVLGLENYIDPGATIIGIFAVLTFVSLPGLVAIWLLERKQSAERKEDLETYFDELIEEYKKTLFIGRVILERNPQVLRKGPDYYKVLALPREADEDQIKNSFRKLVLEHHPDHSKSKNAEEKFKQIIEAHEILSDPIKKSQYDSSYQIRESPYNDELVTDPVAQAQLVLSAKFNRLLGIIYNLSEREIDRRERIALQQAASVSGAMAAQPMRPVN